MHDKIETKHETLHVGGCPECHTPLVTSSFHDHEMGCPNEECAKHSTPLPGVREYGPRSSCPQCNAAFENYGLKTQRCSRRLCPTRLMGKSIHGNQSDHPEYPNWAVVASSDVKLEYALVKMWPEFLYMQKDADPEFDNVLCWRKHPQTHESGEPVLDTEYLYICREIALALPVQLRSEYIKWASLVNRWQLQTELLANMKGIEV